MASKTKRAIYRKVGKRSMCRKVKNLKKCHRIRSCKVAATSSRKRRSYCRKKRATPYSRRARKY
jgi:hypothetical protein